MPLPPTHRDRYGLRRTTAAGLAGNGDVAAADSSEGSSGCQHDWYSSGSHPGPCARWGLGSASDSSVTALMPVLEAGLAASQLRRQEREHSDLACVNSISVQHAAAVFPARAGGSQSGSQRAQSSGDARRRPATIDPGERHIGPREATSGDRLELIWEQEAAGSNPAIPTRPERYRSPEARVGASCLTFPP